MGASYIFLLILLTLTKRKTEQPQQLEIGLATYITNAQKLTTLVSFFNCGSGPVNFPHKLLCQEHIQNYVKLSMYFYIFHFSSWYGYTGTHCPGSKCREESRA
jgi:hypothetical protein